MNHGIWIAIALLAALPAHGQDDVKTGTPPAAAAKPKPPKQRPTKAGDAKGSKGSAKKPDAAGSSAWGGGGAAKASVASKKSAPAPKHAAERANMLRVRATYRYAVESCEQKGKDCDKTLLDDAEVHFMDSCLPCATREQCESERSAIRAGTSKSVTTLCAESE